MIVVPSQILEYIDKRFPEASNQLKDKDLKLKYHSGYHASVNTIVYLLEQLPPNLLTISSDDFIIFTEAINELKKAIAYWNSDHHAKMKHEIYKVCGESQLNPVSIVRYSLTECPDQGTGEKTTKLHFVPDDEFRETLRQDISFVDQSLANAEWKASTILAGSVIEALLLDAISYIKQHDPAKYQCIREHKVLDPSLDGHLDKKPDYNPNGWHLFQYIPFALAAEFITEATAKGCMDAKDFRNLIHPGKSVRKNIVSDRGTALRSVGAMDHTIKDLSTRHPSLWKKVAEGEVVS